MQKALIAAIACAVCTALPYYVAGAYADPTYQPSQQGMAAVPVEVGTSDQQGRVLPTSSANPLPTQSYSDRQISVPTVTASAYSSGNDVGGLNVVPFQGAGPLSLLESVMIKSLSGQTPTLTVYVFDSVPQNSTFTDKGAFSLNTSTPGADGLLDVDRLVMAPFAVTLATSTGTTVSFAENTNLARIPKSGATALWYAIASGSTFTPGSASDFRISFQVVQQHQ